MRADMGDAIIATGVSISPGILRISKRAPAFRNEKYAIAEKYY